MVEKVVRLGAQERGDAAVGLLERHVGGDAVRVGVADGAVGLMDDGAREPADPLLVALHMRQTRSEVGVCESPHDPVCPVEVLGGHVGGGVGEVGRRRRDVGVERHERVEGVGAVGDPLERPRREGLVGPELEHGELVVAVDADGAKRGARRRRPERAVGVEGGALVVERQDVLHVLDRDLPLGNAAPGDVVVLGAVVGRDAVPGVARGVEVALHRPGARRVVHVVRVRARPEGVAGVETAVERDVQVVLAHELAEVGRAEMVAALAEGVVEVEGVESELVGHRDVAVVGDAARDPVVTAHGLHPPDLVDVAERDAVVLVGPVALEKAAQHPDAVAGRAHVGEHEGDHVLLADAAYDLGLVVLLARRALCGSVLDERVGAEHALVGGERLGGAHAHVADREARLLPEAVLAVGVGKRGVAAPALGQGNGEVRDDTRVRGLARGVDDDELLRLEGPAG